MRILAIDCSTEWLAVAVGDGTLLRERREHVRQSHSERVLPLVDALLDEAGWSLDALDGIAFGAGPGSFTGVRIACGVAQGLALGRSLPVVPVTTLEAVADEAYAIHAADRVFACMDARMREVYVAAYARGEGGWNEIEPPRVIKPADVTLPAGTWFGAGDGFAAYPDLATRLGLAAHDANVLPTAAAVVRLALPRFAAGAGVPAEQALPTYVRHRVALTSVERAAGAVL
jgi:tRNA threonylcarbamoyladenosine biosynthesis protein TsaB